MPSPPSRRPPPPLLLGAVLAAGLGCGGGEPSAPPAAERAAVPPARPPVFADVTDAAGVDFTYRIGRTGELHFPEIMGGGAALFDLDGDGDLDLYLPQGGSVEAGAAAPAGILYRNDGPGADGVPRFTDVTADSGLPAAAYGQGVAAGDFDGDGRVDLYRTAFGPDQLLRNLGGGRFTDVTAGSGIAADTWSVAATWFDFDGDGDLDLFVGDYVDFKPWRNKPCRSATGRRDYCGPTSYRGEPDRLYRNDGGGRFTDVSPAAGLAARPAAALGVVAVDLDGDGRLDLYVANDQAANHLWLNLGGGRFAEAAAAAGLAVDGDGRAQASMGVDAGDADGDGDFDLFLTHLTGETNTLYVQGSPGLFHDGTTVSGLGHPSLPYTGFGTAWIDVDLDGNLDLVVANGAVLVIEEKAAAGDDFPFGQPDQLFRNLGGGRFAAVPAAEAGAHFARQDVGRGIAVGDLDDDGDPDLVVVAADAPVRVLLNRAGDGAAWLGVAPQTAAGSPALGAVVTAVLDDGSRLVRRAHADGGYASSHDPRVVFGLGAAGTPARRVVSVIVRWAEGGEEEWTGLEAGRYHPLRRGEGRRPDGGAGR